MENDWTKKIKELTESRDQWKLEWGLLMSDLNAANDRNTELEAALKRETNEYIEASHTLIIERDEAREQVKKLEAERDADRRREYGYSQQTVDALTLERDKLRAERNDWKARYQSVSEMHDALIAEFNEMRAENRRLVALNDTFPPEIARLEDRISEEYEAERADDRARIKELEAENERLREALKYIAFTTPGPTMKTHSDAAEQALKEASHD
jgi:chromosome segregation ATPase